MSSTSPERPTTYVALLRGINVGGRATIEMARLKTCVQDHGFSNVSTYINSGNVIFQSSETDPRQLESNIELAITAVFSQHIAVIVRSLNDMQQLVDHIPDSWRTQSGLKCNVIFLRPKIDSPELVEQLNPKPDIEELYYHPGVLFWSAHTGDLTKSSMLKVNRLRIYQDMTVRGLRTTLKLYDLMKQVAA